MIIRNKEQYDAFMDQLAIRIDQPLAVDTETEKFKDKSDIKPWELALEGVGVYHSEEIKGYILPELLDDRFQTMLDTHPIIMHNAKYDLSVLGTRYDFEGVHIDDSMIMAWVCNENRQSFKLKDLAQSILKVKEVTRFTDLEEKPEGDTTAWVDAMGTYCLSDCEYTLRLFHVFKKKIQAEGLWKLYDEIERPLVNVVRHMEERGILIDVPYLEEMKVKLEAELGTLKESVLSIIKTDMKGATDDFNVGSTKQLGEYLFKCKKYKIPEDMYTPTGKPSTNEAALKYLAAKYKCPVSQGLLRVRELTKLLTAFVNSLLDRQKDSVIHCSFRQSGTVTGRFSCANPNLQQQPNSKEFDLRRAFKARPGYKFVVCDFSQVELRIAAALSGSKLMVDTYKNNGDIHQTTADAVGCDRQKAKTLNFSLLYGISAYGLSKRLEIPEDEGQKLIDGFFHKFHEVQGFLDDAANSVKTKCYVETMAGRRRRFPDYIIAAKSGDYPTVGRIMRQAGNAIIQGTSADITKIAMVRLGEKLKQFGAHLLLVVHDECVVEVPEDRVKEAEKVVQECMEGAMDLGDVKLVAEPKSGYVWAK